MLSRVEHRIKSGAAGWLDLKSPAQTIFAFALSRRVAGESHALPDFNFPFFLGELDGIVYAAPGEMGNSSWHRILSREASKRIKASKLGARRQMFLRHALASGGALIDIGANVGLTSIPHAILGDFHPVIAVEPELRNFTCLQWNTEANGASVVCRHVAVGAEPGTGVLKIKRTPTHHYLAEGARAEKLAKTGKGERVEVVTVDQLASDIGRLALVKVDVQGCEADVFRGAADVLKRREAAWLVEIAAVPRNLDDGQTAFIAETVENHFDGFIDTRTLMSEVRSTRHFRDYLGSLDRKFTDFVLIP